MSQSSPGFVSLVLHCHLPFVRHPEHDYFLEEYWYYEALFETYLPLLEVLDRLEKDQVPFRLTLSVSPTLLSMCQDPLLQKRAVRYVDQLLSLVAQEKKRVGNDAAFGPVVRMYEEKLTRYRDRLVNHYGGNMALGLKQFQAKGRLEIITCAATHGFLPLLRSHGAAVRAQIETGLETHEAFFGKRPTGFWLPECAYEPGLDEFLKDAGIEYTFLETHGVLQASPRPRFGTFAPIVCPSGVKVFGRDLESAKQVWSSKEGYPGDPDYREFYRDVAHRRAPAGRAARTARQGLRRRHHEPAAGDRHHAGRSRRGAPGKRRCPEVEIRHRRDRRGRRAFRGRPRPARSAGPASS